MAEQEFLTVNQLAKAIGVCPMTVYKWSCSGFLPCYRFGKIKKFRLDEVLEWAKNRGSQGRKRMNGCNQHV